MRIAVISITSEGAKIADNLASILAGDIEVFARTGHNPFNANKYEKPSQLIAKLFHQYDGFILVMLVSMAVRFVSPHVRDKYFDPAVVVVDEAGNYAISLLAGHLGCTNTLTCQVGQAIGAQSIITSAIDVFQKPAIDLLAVKINATVEPVEKLVEINAIISAGEKLGFFLDRDLPDCETYKRLAEETDINLRELSDLANVDEYDAAVIITDRNLFMVKPCVYLRPASLAMVIDCDKDTPSSQIMLAIAEVCNQIGRSLKSVAVISAVSELEEMIGLLATSQQLDIPIEFIDIGQLSKQKNDFNELVSLAAGQSGAILGQLNLNGVKVAISQKQGN